MVRKTTEEKMAAERRLQEERTKRLEEFTEDPFMGFSSLDEALTEAKFTSQPEVLARLLNRENLFISGMAGSGKTTIIDRFVKLLDAEYDGNFDVAVTASTGIAASLIGGQTIHSWAGLGISTEPFNSNKIPGQQWAKREVFQTTDVLIIDEISMMPAYLFTKLDKTLQHFRRSKEPFGGIQVVFIGDFMQLPPVDKGEEGVDARFAIQTDSWKNADVKYCYLDKSYRATDARLKQLLLDISLGRITEETKFLVGQRMGSSLKDENKVYTTLYTTNRNVDSFNEKRLAENTNREVVYPVMRGEGTTKDIEALMKRYGIPERITLKKDATVMLTKNITLDQGGRLLPNGSLGKVVSLDKHGVKVLFNSGEEHYIGMTFAELTKKTPSKFKANKMIDEVLATVWYLPIKLGYSITVHKSQGQTFDGVVTDLSTIFQPGLGYVALSRVRDLDDLVILGFDEKAYEVSPLSQKITVYAKKRAILERRQFIEERESYEELLVNDLARLVYWDVEAKRFSKGR